MNWVCAPNWYFIISFSLQTDVVDLRYFNLDQLVLSLKYLIFIPSGCNDIDNFILFLRLNSFTTQKQEKSSHLKEWQMTHVVVTNISS